jgi:hypothetical protein
MDTEFITLKPFTASDALVPCAIRLKAPSDVARVATHFILLLDVSESMNDANKLENVKKCSSLILNFLTPEDRVSLITFGEGATLHLKRVIADEVHKSSMRSVIQSLKTDGCTNLSAGLGYVREVCEGDTQKAGLLILTDGHINRGVSDSPVLRNIITGLRSTFSHLSVHCIAYGSDHNEDLLRGVAEDNQGSYNVVNTIEDTAFAFGETLGGLISCAFQNVRLDVPVGSVVHGPHKHTVSGERRSIQIGDVYAGTKPLILVDIPGSAWSQSPIVRVQGMTLPTLESWTNYPIHQELEGRSLDIELAQHRYECSAILHALKTWHTLAAVQRSRMEARITEFKTRLSDSFFDGSPVATLLRDEVETLQGMLRQALLGHLTHEDSVMATQHMASISMGRGFSSPMAPRRTAGLPPAVNRRQSRFAPPASLPPSSLLGVSVESDPSPALPQAGEAVEPEADAVPPPQRTPASAFQNDVQLRIASLMQTASQLPE